MVLNRIRALLRGSHEARTRRSGAAREPQESLETLHLRQLDLLQRVRIETVEAMAARRRLEARIQALEEEADRAAAEARISANVESDASVRDLVRREAAARERASGLSPIVERLRDNEDVLTAAVARLASRVDAFADRKEALLARASAGEATDRVAAEAREFHELSASIDGALRQMRVAAGADEPLTAGADEALTDGADEPLTAGAGEALTDGADEPLAAGADEPTATDRPASRGPIEPADRAD